MDSEKIIDVNKSFKESLKYKKYKKSIKNNRSGLTVIQLKKIANDNEIPILTRWNKESIEKELYEAGIISLDDPIENRKIIDKKKCETNEVKKRKNNYYKWNGKNRIFDNESKDFYDLNIHEFLKDNDINTEKIIEGFTIENLLLLEFKISEEILNRKMHIIHLENLENSINSNSLVYPEWIKNENVKMYLLSEKNIKEIFNDKQQNKSIVAKNFYCINLDKIRISKFRDERIMETEEIFSKNNRIKIAVKFYDNKEKCKIIIISNGGKSLFKYNYLNNDLPIEIEGKNFMLKPESDHKIPKMFITKL